MAQALNDIIAELDASYNPARKTINDRINGLQGAQNADVAGLQAQQTQAFDDITAGARARGLGFSGIPLGEQAKYTSSQFLPAVAHVKQQYNETRSNLFDALNNLGLDQMKTAQSLRQTQLDRDFQAEQARLAREAQDRAAAASNASLASLFGGGDQAPAQPDEYAKLGNQKAQAMTAIKSLLGTNNVGLIAKTINAISNSAARGNLYDKYKLDLLQTLQGNSSYGSLLSKVASQNNRKFSNKVTF